LEQHIQIIDKAANARGHPQDPIDVSSSKGKYTALGVD